MRNLGEVARNNASYLMLKREETALDVAQHFVDRHLDCACVGEDGVVAGVVTLRDIVRLIARREPLVGAMSEKFMTLDPVVLPTDASSTDAVAAMRAGGYRHIAVVDQSGKLCGVIDVLQLVYDAIMSMQYKFINSRRAFSMFRATTERLELPTLSTLSNSWNQSAAMRPNDSVLQGADVLNSTGQSALGVTDKNGRLIGIVTSRDILKQSVGDLEALSKLQLEDIMSISPEVASPHETLLDALQKMQARGCRHLPIVDESGRVVNIVSALQVASSALLEGYNEVDTHNFNKPSSFWRSLFSTPSSNRDSHRDSHRSHRTLGPSAGRNYRNQTSADFKRSLPDSDEQSEAPERSYTFKFKDKSGDFRRIKVQSSNFDWFQMEVRKRFGAHPTSQLKIKYFDADGDEVRVASDEDLEECLETAAHGNWSTIRSVVEEIGGQESKDASDVDTQALPQLPAPSSEHSRTEESAPQVPKGGITESSMTASDAPAQSATIQSKSGPESTAHALVTKAMTCLREGRLEDAVAAYDEAIAAEPLQPRAYCGRAAAKLIQHEALEALNSYNKAIELADGAQLDREQKLQFLDMCNSGAAEALIELRRYEEAGVIFKELNSSESREDTVQAFIDEAEACTQSARKAFQGREAVEASDLFNGAIRIEAVLEREIGRPRSSKLFVERAACYLAMEEVEMALEDYQSALKFDPESRDALLGRAECLQSLDRASEAKAAFQLCLKLWPGTERAERGLTQVRPQAAAEETRKIADLSSTIRQISSSSPRQGSPRHLASGSPRHISSSPRNGALKPW